MRNIISGKQRIKFMTPRYTYWLQIYEVDVTKSLYSTLRKEIGLMEPRIPINELSEDVYIKIYEIIYQTESGPGMNTIHDYKEYCGTILFQN